MMNDLKKQSRLLIEKLQKYRFVIAVAIFAGLCGVILWTSSQQVLREPSKGSVLDQVSSTERPNLDEDAARTLLELEDQNIEVKALFEESRNNPFTE